MSTLDQALVALQRGVPAHGLEGARLDFKEQSDNLKRTLEVVADAVVCLANGEGGHVVLGVADRPGSGGSLLGVKGDLSTEALIRGVFDRTRPPLSVAVDDRDVDGARLLVITVPQGATMYANAKGTATRRVGTECRPFPPEEQKQALASRGLHDWSEQRTADGLEDTDPAELVRVRRLLTAAGREDHARLDDAPLLRDLRLLNGAGRLTNAGLILLGTRAVIADTLPTYGYSYQYRPSPGSQATDHFRETRPLLAAVEHLLGAIEARRTLHPINVAGGVQLQLQDYPPAAVRELVVNALVHRDYQRLGTVDIEHTPDQLIISSPGGLVFGVTPANILTHPSTPRNRLLLEVVATLQVAERTGQGVDRAYREVLRIGKPPPTYRDDGSRTVVGIRGGTGNDRFARYVNADLFTELAGDLDILLLLSQLRDKRTTKAGALAPLIQRSAQEAQAVLDRASDAGLVVASKRTSRTPYPTYSLTPAALAGLGRAVAYNRQDADVVEAKVIEHVLEYGHITNQTLRRMFDLTIYQARDLLKELQRRGVLLKIDDKSAGPGVRYGIASTQEIASTPKTDGGH